MIRQGFRANGSWRWFLLLPAVFVLQGAMSAHLENWSHPDSLKWVKEGGSRTFPSTMRAVAMLSGFRVLAAHFFWMKLLVYYGDSSNSRDRYSGIYDYSNILADLNPHFIPNYTLCAAVLAFHVKRLPQAEDLLIRGIRDNPKADRLKLLLAAILYQNISRYDKVIPFLEAQMQSGEVPDIYANILANAYKKAGYYEKSIQLWRKILRKSNSVPDQEHAIRQLEELYSLVGKRK